MVLVLHLQDALEELIVQQQRSRASGVTVAQFDKGSVPTHVVRTPDNNYLLYPYPDKSYLLSLTTILFQQI